MNEETRDPENYYTAAHVWEYLLDDYYHHVDGFGGLLAKALSYLPQDDAHKIVDAVFFVPQESRSMFFSQSFIRQRAIILVSSEDWQGDETNGIVTILHEAGHAFLGHGKSKLVDTPVYERDEDECWDQVRKWLPAEFHETIDEKERVGGGNRGFGFLPDK